MFIKIQPDPTGRGGTFAKQLALREKLLAIRHPNLLRCFDLDLEGKALCEVYEWLDGRELTAALANQREKFDDARLRRMVTQLAEAIHTLHTATSLSHRDLKPDNIRVVNRQGREEFVIVDYGTVSQLDSGGATTVAGTRVYSPPEFYQRRIPNDPLLSTWDWWSLGRIVQEAIDRIHLYDRLSQLFAQDLQSGDHQARVAVELMFDTIMLENERAHYGMRAGMVELTEAGGRLPHWLPLLRGLLTSHRRGRWGYPEVQRFLAGERVPDSYGAKADVEGFELGKRVLTLPELAQTLMAESAPDTPAGAARWAEAVELVYRGRLGRYVTKVLQDSDLARQLQEYQKMEDRDLGTALALAAISEGTVAPAVRGQVINLKFLLSEASRLPDEVPPPARISTLLSSGFQARLKALHPAHAAELEQESLMLGGLGDTCRKLGVKNDLFGMGTVLRARHVPQETLLATLAAARTQLYQTDNEALQELFATPDPSKLSTFDLQALTLATLQSAKHGFRTHQDHASSLKQSAVTMRNALALSDAAFYCHPYFDFFRGSFWKLFAAATVLAGGFTFWRAVVYADRFGPNTSNSSMNWNLYLAVSVGFGLAFAAVRYLWHWELVRFTRPFIDYSPERLTHKALQVAAGRLGGHNTNHRRALRRINKEIGALPYIDPAENVTHPADTSPLRRPLLIQLALLALLAIGGWFGAGPLLVSQRVAFTPSQAIPTPRKAAPVKRVRPAPAPQR